MSLIMCEYVCFTACGLRHESLESRASIPDDRPCPDCGATASLIISAPMPRDKTRAVQAVTTGKSDPRPPSHVMLDTRKMGLDGQAPWEFHRELDKRDRDLRLKEIKKEYG